MSRASLIIFSDGRTRVHPGKQETLAPGEASTNLPQSQRAKPKIPLQFHSDGFSVAAHVSDSKELKTVLERNMMVHAFSPRTRRQRQAELYEFEARLVYMASSRSVRDTQ